MKFVRRPQPPFDPAILPILTIFQPFSLFPSPHFSPLSPFDPELRFARRRFTEHTRYRASRVERNGKKIDALEQIHRRD